MGDEWIVAKRRKDFDTADRLRTELHERGIEAEKLRPKGWEQTVFPPSGSAAAEALLDDWVEAKRAKNFNLADEIREELREMGIAADAARPDPRQTGDAGRGSARHDRHHSRDAPKQNPSQRHRRDEIDHVSYRRSRAETEELLDEWVQAKRAKEFEKADALREQLQ